MARGGLHAYEVYREAKSRLGDVPFSTLLFLAFSKADTANTAKFKAMWPDLHQEFQDRYNAPGGRLPGEGEQ